MLEGKQVFNDKETYKVSKKTFDLNVHLIDKKLILIESGSLVSF